MRISRTNIDELNAIISVVIRPDDYQDKVERQIKEKAKKVKLPGYRNGLAPVSHVQKIYGRGVIIEEVNKILGDVVNNYIKQNEIETLGQPLQKGDESQYNWELGQEFTFEYEIGLAPDVITVFNASDSLIHYVIKVDEETLNARLKNLRRSYGKMTNPETSADGDVIFADFVQLQNDGSVLENGINVTSTLRIDIITDANLKAPFIGVKRDDVIENFNLVAAIADEVQLRKILKLDDNNQIIPQSNFSITIKNINRLEESDLDLNFYNKVFGEDAGVNTEEEFKKRITAELELMMLQDADRKLAADFYQYGSGKIDLKLPDDFLKRWLKTVNREISAEDLEAGYPDFATNLKWTLLENKIVKDNKIEIKYADVFEAAKLRIASQLKMYNPTPVTEEQLTEYTNQFLKENQNINQTFDEVKSNKVFEFLKTVITLNKQEISFKDFKEL
ncbi:MAG: trigger factor [Sphingobacteriales bacterium]|nr:MAG: trigger factor [Sphingobacteriales bacterium]